MERGFKLFVGIAILLSLGGCGGGETSSVTRGGKIVFTSSRGGNADIFLMEDNGSNVQKLTTFTGLDIAPSLSRDKTHIVYASRRSTNFDLFIMNADGTGERRLTDSPDADELDPDISPDGRTIVFTRAGSIYAINSDGSDERRLTNSPGDSENASFSGRGDRLVFQSNRDGGGFQIYVMNVDGSGQTALTHGTALNTEARFNPAGTQIVFLSSQDTVNPSLSGIYVMNADGSNPQQILMSGSAPAAGPAFSPDGQELVFASKRGGPTLNLYTIHTDGTTLTRLTNDEDTDAFPCWR